MTHQTAPVSVLVVEDEILIAADLEYILLDGGLSVIGPCASLDEAMAAIETSTPDFALLDCDLAGVSSMPLARELRRRAIPFAFLTGLSGSAAASQKLQLSQELQEFQELQLFHDSAILCKPFQPQDVLNLIRAAGLNLPTKP